MDIYINGEQLSFELENEQNAFDVIMALGDFYAKEEPQQFITSIMINAKEYSYADDAGLKAVEIGNIQKLEIEFNDIVGVSLLSIEQIHLYLDFINALVEKNIWDEGFIKVQDSLNWMQQGINQIVTIFGSTKGDLSALKNRFMSRFQVLESFFTDFKKSDIPFDDNKKTEILLSIKDVQQVLHTFFTSLNNAVKKNNPETLPGDVDEVVTMLDAVIPHLADVPLKFQKGDDRGAMETIQSLALAIDNAVSLFISFKEVIAGILDGVLIDGLSFDDFLTKMTGNLKELVNSMETNDSVMMGDLVEYEFLPYAEEIRNILQKIRKDSLINVN